MDLYPSGRHLRPADDAVSYHLYGPHQLLRMEHVRYDASPLGGLIQLHSFIKRRAFLACSRFNVLFYLCRTRFEVILGIAIALLLSREFRGKNLVKTVFLLPMVATPVAMGLVWMLIYEPTIGVANMMLKSLGLEPLLWLASPIKSFRPWSS